MTSTDATPSKPALSMPAIGLLALYFTALVVNGLVSSGTGVRFTNKDLSFAHPGVRGRVRARPTARSALCARATPSPIDEPLLTRRAFHPRARLFSALPQSTSRRLRGRLRFGA
jgi:hypothetical protein